MVVEIRAVGTGIHQRIMYRFGHPVVLVNVAGMEFYFQCLGVGFVTDGRNVAGAYKCSFHRGRDKLTNKAREVKRKASRHPKYSKCSG